MKEITCQECPNRCKLLVEEENGEIVLGYELYTYENIYGEVLLEYYSTLPLTTLMALEENIVFYAVWEKES